MEDLGHDNVQRNMIRALGGGRSLTVTELFEALMGLKGVDPNDDANRVLLRKTFVRALDPAIFVAFSDENGDTKIRLRSP